MRKEEDQSVPQRQDMVDLKEREAEQAQQQAQAERDRIAQQEQQLADQRAQAERDRQNLENQRQDIAQQQQAGTITDDQAREAQDNLDQAQQDLDQRDQEIAQQQSDLDASRDNAQRLDDLANQKIDEAQQERQDIARDQQAGITQPAAATGILGITIEKSSPPMGRLVLFNPTTGEELKRSPLDSVHVRTVTFIGGKIIAVAGENVNQGAVRIIEIAQDTLTMAKQGDDDIEAGSLLWVNGNDLYAVTASLSDQKYYIGRFDVNLALQAKSTVAVNQEATVAIQQGQLLTQREDGSPLILSPATLAEAFPAAAN